MALASSVAGGIKAPTVVTPAYTAAYRAALARGNTPANSVIAAKKATLVAPKPVAPKPPTGSINRPVINPTGIPNGGIDPGGKVKIGSSIDQYLTNDPTYQTQQSAILKALGDYKANELNSENSYNSQYGLNTQNINEQNRTSGIAQQEDYASRGMVRSGLYGVADADRRNDYARQQSQLDMSKQAYITGLRNDTANYQTQQQLAQQQARQDAINRRALALTGSGSTTGVV